MYSAILWYLYIYILYHTAATGETNMLSLNYIKMYIYVQFLLIGGCSSVHADYQPSSGFIIQQHIIISSSFWPPIYLMLVGITWRCNVTGQRLCWTRRRGITSCHTPAVSWMLQSVVWPDGKVQQQQSWFLGKVMVQHPLIWMQPVIVQPERTIDPTTCVSACNIAITTLRCIHTHITELSGNSYWVS